MSKMNPLLYLFMLSTVILGTIIVFLSSHWFFIWLGLEINTLAFLPLLVASYNPRSTEAATKYFLIQALASALLLLGGLLHAATINSWDPSSPLTPLPLTLLLIAIALKMAIPPCHNWLPDVLQGLPLLTGLILSTWQKLAPFYILITIQESIPTWLIVTAGFFAALVGGWGGLNQTQIRKLLAFSSIAHIGWTIAIIPFSPQLATLNLIIYFTITSTLFLAFHTLHTLNLANLSNSTNFAPWLTTLTLITTLSLAGLPPLTGFLGKWLIIQELALNTNTPAILILVLGNLLSLFYYLRIAYVISLTLSPQHTTSTLAWRTSPSSSNFPLALLIILSTCTLLISPSWLPLTF
ncbi:NADH dehydrogenase subunit 2 (mitochondrion) [Saccoglossus kowalevskii]|uniref:NADH-ubiquinone oxidoreductase chain 2 n=1 Tax=Saccoglossus kowalevskii TaxID=10224 RepID=Q3L8S9_SACKO|nr:NADH dehydrogenase subunit 2 [Saccoglossus kowalevskii]AAQ92989.1 NADH dehydrogenase subunit 2 [Saccoglossus kowalevskii]